MRGYYVAARRDRTANGGGVLIYVRGALAAVELEVGGGDSVELVAIELPLYATAVRVACGYRPPGDDAAAFFGAVSDFGASAERDGAVWVLAADVNVWGFDARAVGGDADERAFRSLLAERDGSRGLSGTARGCAASRAFTRVPEQVGGVARELDYLVGCASAAAAFMRGATENGCGVAGAAPWVWSDHRPVWVELDLGAVAGAASAVSSLPIESPLPGAKWDLATPAHHAALRAECVTQLAPIEAALREGGLARWEGHAEHAAAEIARVLVDVETAAIGRPRRTQEHGRPPMWWTAEVAAAADDCEDWVAILQAATAAGGSIALDDGAVISTAHA